jgi:DNA polymerase-3 subunit alpha/error-prone DNA polymerase
MKAIKVCESVLPVEFMVAVIHNQGGFTERKCMCMRLKCLAVSSILSCVNKSEYEATVYGLKFIWV